MFDEYACDFALIGIPHFHNDVVGPFDCDAMIRSRFLHGAQSRESGAGGEVGVVEVQELGTDRE